MKIRTYLTKLAVITICLLCATNVAFALPSLDAQNWDTLTVEERIGSKNAQTVITVIRDFSKPLVWYYVPSRPRLAESVFIEEGKEIVKPEFQLMTLQTKDAKSRDIYEEGLLQFSLRMDLQPKTASQAKSLIFDKEKAKTDANNAKITALQNEITELEKKSDEASKKMAKFKKDEVKKLEAQVKVTSRDQIRLIPLPVASASISIYEPNGKWLSSGVQSPAIAPTFSTQAVPFQINLTSLGADAMKALTQKGQGGLGVYYQLEFEGTLPPSKIKVEVDWKQTFKHFSENTKKKHYWNALLFAGGTKTTDTKKISEELLENKCIKVIMEGREDELEALQDVLDPIMERINNELVAKMAPPEKVDPAEAKDPSYGIGMFYGGGSSYAMKDLKVEKLGKETITFDRAKTITRATSCGTFIGIGNYNQEIIDAANIVMDPGNWEKAYFTIPKVFPSPNLLTVTLNQYVQYKENSGKPAGAKPNFPGCENPQLIIWKPDAVNGQPGWVDKNGNSAQNISWPLQALYAEARAAGKDINDYVEYKVEMIITNQEGRLVNETNLTKIIPMMSGDKPVTNPMAMVQELIVSAEELPLYEDDELKRVSFTIVRKSKDGKKKYDTYRWTFNQKDMENDEYMHSWYIPKDEEYQFIPTVKFYPSEKVNGKSVVEWEFNGKDLIGPGGYGDLHVVPSYDPDYEPEN